MTEQSADTGAKADPAKSQTLDDHSLDNLSLDDLWHLAHKQALPPLDWRSAIAALRDDKAWHVWATRMLALIGAAHLLAGIIFFFAYNWADLSKMAKFAILFAGLGGSFALWWMLGPDRRAGEIMGVTATVLTGVLLAVFGQIYQTGADAHDLFIAWALLTLPWACLSLSPLHMLVWILVANTAFGLFASQVMHPMWGFSGPVLLVSNALGAGLLLVSLKAAAKARPLLLPWWLEGFLILGLASCIAGAGWEAAFNAEKEIRRNTGAGGELLAILAIQVSLFWFFLAKAQNRLGSILTLASLISASTLFVLLEIADKMSESSGLFFLLIAVIIALASGLFIKSAKRAMKYLDALPKHKEADA